MVGLLLCWPISLNWARKKLDSTLVVWAVRAELAASYSLARVAAFDAATRVPPAPPPLQQQRGRRSARRSWAAPSSPGLGSLCVRENFASWPGWPCLMRPRVWPRDRDFRPPPTLVQAQAQALECWLDCEDSSRLSSSGTGDALGGEQNQQRASGQSRVGPTGWLADWLASSLERPHD